jgi:nitrogenase-associated protein
MTKSSKEQTMAQITYYTKIGCMTSTKQIELLQQSGHEVEVRDLLTHPWQPEELLSYFGNLPVASWFNPNSPRVKSGEVDPSVHDSAAALELLLADHLLIRRPLMVCGSRKLCGFDPETVHAWMGLKAPDEAIARSGDFQTCSHPPTSGEPPACP